MDPLQLLEVVKDNVIVQWFLVVVFILLVGTNTATKLKGPLGGFARWVRSIGEKRDEREASERRAKRLALLQDAAEGREYVQAEINQHKEQIRYLYQNQQAMEMLIRAHLGWDYERVRQLISLGVSPSEIPSPPPLRVELKDPDTVPQKKTVAGRRRRAPDPDENPQVQPATD
jgi:Sec-independent protein translocase protein TatA